MEDSTQPKHKTTARTMILPATARDPRVTRHLLFEPRWLLHSSKNPQVATTTNQRRPASKKRNPSQWCCDPPNPTNFTVHLTSLKNIHFQRASEHYPSVATCCRNIVTAPTVFAWQLTCSGQNSQAVCASATSSSKRSTKS